MNLFILDSDPVLNAQYHNDKHVVKMILEAAQLACTVHHLRGGSAQYKPTHKNHPLTLWANWCLGNYLFVVQYGMSLCSEYEHRYGRVHACRSVLTWLWCNMPSGLQVGGSPLIYVGQEDCRVDDVVESYRNYYRQHKIHIAKWTGRGVPGWYS